MFVVYEELLSHGLALLQHEIRWRSGLTGLLSATQPAVADFLRVPRVRLNDVFYLDIIVI